MGIFDIDNGDFCHQLSDDMLMDSEGNLMHIMSNNIAMDIDSGELHFISGFSKLSDEENDEW